MTALCRRVEGSWDAPDAVVPAGVSDAELATALAPLTSAAVIELSSADTLLCGLSPDLPLAPDAHVAPTPAAFNALAAALLEYPMWFCLTEPWQAAGANGFVPGVEWERDVVTRHCGADEGALRRGGRLRPGVVQDEPLCACEWGFALPPDLPVLPPGSAACAPEHHAAAARLLRDEQ